LELPALEKSILPGRAWTGEMAGILNKEVLSDVSLKVLRRIGKCFFRIDVQAISVP